jgi:(S)-2-hydroxyglutarate dehydrogenase
VSQTNRPSWSRSAANNLHRMTARTDVFDVAIVGGGIIGLATAHAILNARPTWSVVVLEKERRIAAHQSGRNSGVLHSGIYYRPGSLKARLAVAGRESMVCFCSEHGVPFEICGKLIVAVDEAERARLLELHRRAHANGVRANMVERAGIEPLEPHARGIAALHVPDAGLVDFSGVCSVLAEQVTGAGAEIRLDWPVDRLVLDGDRTRLESQRGDLTARCAVNCAGLFSDVLALQSTATAALRIVPFRGEYHELVPGREQLVENMIYPVPDPALPFLGVHLTRGIDGRVHAGPNAVLALSREGYSWSQVDGSELRDLVRSPGFRKLAGRFWRIGAGELFRSLSRRALARALRRLVPEVGAADLVRAPSGVRAQAVGADGTLIDDFVLTESPGAVHVLNAPSPAATASLEIGNEIARRVHGHVDDR